MSDVSEPNADQPDDLETQKNKMNLELEAKIGRAHV